LFSTLQLKLFAAPTFVVIYFTVIAMGDNEGRGPPVLHFSSTVAPADSPAVQQLYPTLPLDELAQPVAVGKFSVIKTLALNNQIQFKLQAGTPSGGGPSVTYHRRLPQMPKVNINMPALPTMPSINVPQMMNISSYIPEMKTPAFLKDVYALPVQVGGQINRGVHQIGDNINKVYSIKLSNCFLWSIVKRNYTFTTLFRW